MDYVKKSIEKRALHKMEYDSRVNERVMQTTEEKVDSSKALDASLVIIESNETELQEQDTSSRSGNDAHVDDADIQSIEKTRAMAEVKVNPKWFLMLIIPIQCESEQALNVSAGPSSLFKRRLIAADQALGIHFNDSDHTVQKSEFRPTALNSQVQSWFQVVP
ncbi:hypothetical protein Tco_0133849 [Tanacetum coccineum]